MTHKHFISLAVAALFGLMLPAMAHETDAAITITHHLSPITEADEVPVTYLVLIMEDDSEVRFAVSDYPALAFDDDKLTATCNGYQMKTDLVGLRSYHFETRNVSTGIDQLSADGDGKAQPVVSFGEVTVSGMTAGSAVILYDMQGHTLQRTTATADGKARLDIRQLPQGVYIVRLPGQSFKITKK